MKKPEMKKLGASFYAMLLMVHNMHLSVRGIEFEVYHKFFGELYGDLIDSTDVVLELFMKKSDEALPPINPAFVSEFSVIDVGWDIKPEPRDSLKLLELNLNLLNQLIASVAKESKDDLAVNTVCGDLLVKYETYLWRVESCL